MMPNVAFTQPAGGTCRPAISKGVASMPSNQYLEGNFAPVSEEVTLTDLPIRGRIPDHLDGRYLRNGPNPVTPPDPATYHWFLGDGMVHGIRLRDGRAEWYRNRWVRSQVVSSALGEQPRLGPVHAGMDFAANTNVVGQAGRTFAIVEGGALPYELTDTLDTVGPCDFDGTLDGGFSAHPHRDPLTGELHTVSYFWGWGNRVRYTVLGTDARIRRSVDIEVHGSPMMHDFSLTTGHVVLYDLPVEFNLDVVAGTRPGAPTFPYVWNADYPARVGVVARDSDGSDVRWFEVDPCYVYHAANAYEDGDRIVLDVIRHPRTFDRDRLGPNEGASTFERWTLDPSRSAVSTATVDDRGQEFPRIDERLLGSRHSVVYTAAFQISPEAQGDRPVLLRHNLDQGSCDVRDFGAHATIGEFVFVSNGADAAEDDGVLMGLVHDGDTGLSALRILDSATLEDVATVALPVRVPNGFHGNWIPTLR